MMMRSGCCVGVAGGVAVQAQVGASDADAGIREG